MHRNVRRHWQGLDVHVSVLRIERLKTAATLKRFSRGKVRYTFGNGRRGQLIAIVARSLRATSCLPLSGRAGPLMCHLGRKLRTIVAGGGQRVVAIKGGRIIANGTPSEVLVPQVLAEVFGYPMQVIDVGAAPFVLHHRWCMASKTGIDFRTGPYAGSKHCSVPCATKRTIGAAAGRNSLFAEC